MAKPPLSPKQQQCLEGPSKPWKGIVQKSKSAPLMPHSERRKLIELPFPIVRSLPHSRAHGGCMTVDDKVSNRAHGTHGTRRLDPTESE